MGNALKSSKSTKVEKNEKSGNGGKKLQLKKRKLEERIAPGMLGGGVVDPGMVDTVDGGEASSDQQNTTSGEYQDTNIESDYINSNSGSGYIDENTTQSTSTTATAAADNTAYQNSTSDYKPDYQYNEFDSGANTSEYVEQGHSWNEPDWVTQNADGSIHIQPPEGVSIENGVANFPMEVANSELPISEEIQIQSDGSVNMKMPEGTQYIEGSNTIVLPEGSVPLNEVQEVFTAYENPDGSINMVLPEDSGGFNPETGELNLSNIWANQLMPENVEINTDGSVNVAFPEGSEFNADGSIDVPANGAHFMDDPPPEYCNDMDCAHMNNDGSFTFEPPEGIDVENGIVTIPPAMITEVLPLDENLSFNNDGTMDYKVPESTVYDPSANSLTFASGTLNSEMIPEGVNYHSLPEGGLLVQIPDGMNFNAEAGTIKLDNYWSNEALPDNMQLSPSGEMNIALPPETEFYNDGTFTIPSEQLDFIEQPVTPLDTVDFARMDGDVYQVMPPTEYVVNPGDGTIAIPYSQLDSLPGIPDDVTFNANGTMTVEAPAGTLYNAELSTLTFPQSTVHLNEIPEGITAYQNSDGTITAQMPDGVAYDSNTNTVTFDNYWTNQLTPPNIEITAEGSVVLDLPSGTEFHPNGTLEIPADQANFIENPEPALLVGAPDFIEGNPDGSITVMPTEGMSVNPETHTVQMSGEFVNEQFDHCVPEEITFNADGTATVQLPTQTSFNPDSNALTFAAGEVHMHELPSEFQAHVNPDGTITAYLPDGINYQEGGTLRVDNYWVNELTPPCVEYTAEGVMKVDLPQDVQYFNNGSFTIPEYQNDFIENPAQGYVVNGPAWVSEGAMGEVHATAPEGVQVDPQNYNMSMNYEQMHTHFDNYIPEDMHFNPDGTANLELPANTTYNASANAITLPAGEVHGNDVPEGINVTFNADGTATVQLPDGMSYQGDSIRLDNYWVNEFVPPAVEYTPEGVLQVQLPPDTAFHEDGSFTIPAHQCDFIHDPVPTYVATGPEWVSSGEMGEVHCMPPADGAIQVNVNAGTMGMSCDYMANAFPEQIPEDVHFNPDGTMNVELPSGTAFNQAANALLFPVGEVHINEIPPELNPQLNADGSITLPIQPGMIYEAGSNTMHFDNYWTNELTPPSVEFTAEGQVHVTLPPGTEYHSDGSFTIPEYQADFIENPGPAYLQYTPEWVGMNPDGSVCMQPPIGEMGGVQFNPAEGTMSANCEYINQYVAPDMPKDITFNPDGSANVTIAEPHNFNPDTNTLTFTQGTNINEIPPELQPTLMPDGSVVINLPSGISYGDGGLNLSNEWVNRLAPEPIHVATNGAMTVTCPEGTQFGEGYCTIPPENGDFLK
ncbi:MAG: hypothetical protein HQK52_16475 [Oligoflexia bacterium]|nr:hypothetical protein [Oligoflexia bacterium]